MKADLVLRHANMAHYADGAIAVTNGRISWVGADADLPDDLVATKEISLGRRWLSPGLIDCHTHLVYGGNRADEFEKRCEGMTYAQIAGEGGGILSTVQATRFASEDELVAAAQKRADRLLAEGVTTIEVKSGYGLDLNSEVKMLKAARRLRPMHVIATFLGAHALPPEFTGRPDDYLDYVCEVMLPVVARDGLAEAVDMFCETIAFSPDQTRRVLETASDLGLPVKLHADQLSDSGGAKLIAELEGLSADHVEYTSEESVVAMAEAGTVAVLLPGAFYTLREQQRPPVELFRKHGVPMAVATDANPGTSPCTSLLLMMNMACVLFGLTPAEAYAGVTSNAAQALGLDDRGELAVGKLADFAIYNINHPRELAASLGSNPGVQVFIGGKPTPLTAESY